jgi:hypothetical protein
LNAYASTTCGRTVGAALPSDDRPQSSAGHYRHRVHPGVPSARPFRRAVARADKAAAPGIPSVRPLAVARTCRATGGVKTPAGCPGWLSGGVGGPVPSRRRWSRRHELVSRLVRGKPSGRGCRTARDRTARGAVLHGPPPPQGIGLPRKHVESAPRSRLSGLGLLGVHSRYGLPARGAAERPFPSKAPAVSLPPPPLRWLPAGATQVPGGDCTR